MAWDPTQYLKFAAPRLRPALDLLARIDLAAPQHVAELGCGTGTLARLMAKRWADAQVLGIDSSPDMLAKARSEEAKKEAALPNLAWQQADLGRWQPATPPDLIYSNAALHWLPGHDSLFPRLVAALAPEGVLAVQMPRNFGAPSHQLIHETLRQGPWRERLSDLVRPAPVAEPGFYYDLLRPLVRDLDMWETEYQHVLTGPDPVKEWTKGTWLNQFLERLQEPERSQFEADYAARVARAYPPRPDGTTLFPFRRLFLLARL